MCTVSSVYCTRFDRRGFLIFEKTNPHDAHSPISTPKFHTRLNENHLDLQCHIETYVLSRSCTTHNHDSTPTKTILIFNITLRHVSCLVRDIVCSTHNSVLSWLCVVHSKVLSHTKVLSRSCTTHNQDSTPTKSRVNVSKSQMWRGMSHVTCLVVERRRVMSSHVNESWQAPMSLDLLRHLCSLIYFHGTLLIWMSHASSLRCDESCCHM